MTRLKICGLRDADNALAAAEAGADYLGFNFVPGARRQLTAEQARSIILDYRRRRPQNGPRLVGLFADQPMDDVIRTVDYCSLDMAQLCGDEPPEYWRGLSVPVIKQIRVRDQGPQVKAVAETLRRVEEIVAAGYLAMLDKYEEGSLGGTGRSFDWSIAAQIGGFQDFLLAGGLTGENVGRAIATVAPWGVDVSSGVETDGVKDAKKIAAFAEEVARADRRLCESPGP